jgi:ABC-type polysaccharide/polyol phosphate transport system ATPase subunit
VSGASVKAKDLCLNFQLGKPGFMEFITKGTDSDQKLMFTAVNNLSFELKAGDRVGLIGRNGAGKSTLLKLISGVLKPTSGVISHQGDRFPLLDLGADIISSATCLQNIRLRGLLLGLSGDELADYITSVRQNADIEPFLYSPFSTLSSGMKTRLLISLIGNVKPEILIMDEWVGTTDSAFTDKKKGRLDTLVDAAEIFILASHNRSLVKRYCNKVMLLEAGKIEHLGDVQEGYARLKEIMNT